MNKWQRMWEKIKSLYAPDRKIVIWSERDDDLFNV